MTSPTAMPAAEAGVPGSTRATRTPRSSAAPRCLRSSEVRLMANTPSRPLLIDHSNFSTVSEVDDGAFLEGPATALEGAAARPAAISKAWKRRMETSLVCCLSPEPRVRKPRVVRCDGVLAQGAQFEAEQNARVVA